MTMTRYTLAFAASLALSSLALGIEPAVAVIGSLATAALFRVLSIGGRSAL